MQELMRCTVHWSAMTAVLMGMNISRTGLIPPGSGVKKVLGSWPAEKAPEIVSAAPFTSRTIVVKIRPTVITPI